MRLRRNFLIVVAATSLGLVAASAAPLDSPSDGDYRVDRWFGTWDKPTSPGCALAVMKDGRIVYKRGYGMADLDHDVKITTTTVFHVASMSKQFTAAAVLMLAQEGKLSLDDPAKNFVPELPDFGAPITLRHLLHHTSGLRDQWELLSLAGWRYSQDLITDADVLAVVSRQRTLNFPPGSEFLYSNTGFTLLAQVVKHVSGETLRDFAATRLFEPLGMVRTHFRDDHAEIVKDIAYGYEWIGDRLEMSVPNFDTVGATSLLTTVEDLALWDENFYTAKVGGESIIKQLQEKGYLDDGTQINYAAGLNISTYRGLNIVEHAGRDAGYRVTMMRFPDQHFSVAILCNFASIDPERLARRIAEVYLAADLGPAEVPAAAAVSFQPSPDRLAALSGVYVDSADGDRILRLHVEDGRLRGGPIVGRGYALEALDDSRFRYVGSPIELDFQGDKNGAPIGLTSHATGGKPHPFVRASPYEPTLAQLQEFAGIFRSDEIEIPYEVVVNDDHLVTRSLKQKGEAWLPLAPDLFVGGDSRVRFTRDAQGRISGALLNTERTRNFRFERVTQ
jgi:CubicO group peptidase (beta-lactamase class C family)